MWLNRQEDANFDQGHDESMIKEIKLQELKTSVSNLMKCAKSKIKNVIYAELQTELESLSGAKGARKSAQKKTKGSAIKEIRPSNYVTEIYETMALFLNDLVEKKVMCQVPQLQLSNLIGSAAFSVNGRNQHILGHIEYTTTIRELFCVPITCPTVTRPQGVFIFGAKGQGKMSIVSAIAKETDARVFNLSPGLISRTIASDPSFLVNTLKLAKQLAPSLLLIDEAEVIFTKKAVKGVDLDIKTFKKEVAKFMKALQPSDRVLLVAISDDPTITDPTVLKSTFDCFVQPKRLSLYERVDLWNLHSTVAIAASKSASALIFSQLTDGFSTDKVIDSSWNS